MNKKSILSLTDEQISKMFRTLYVEHEILVFHFRHGHRFISQNTESIVKNGKEIKSTLDDIKRDVSKW